MKKIKLNYLVFLFLFFTITSCDKDPVKPNTLLNYTVSNDYINEGEEAYMWLVNSNGDIIAESKLVNGGSGEIKPSEGDVEDRYTLHKLTIFKKIDVDEDWYSLETHSDINIGSIQFKKLKFSLDFGDRLESTELSFSDIPSHDYSLISCGNFSRDNDYLDDKKNIYSYEKDKQGYCYLRDGVKGYYKYIDGLEENVTKEVSISDFSTNMTLHSINLTNNSYFTSIYAHEMKNGLKGKRVYKNSLGGENSTSDFFHLPNEDQFSSTYFYTFSKDKDIDNKTYYFKKTGTVPTTIPTISADIQFSSYNDENLKINVFGDYTEFYFSYRRIDIDTRWFFYGATSDNLLFPEIPMIVKTDHPNVNRALFITAGDIVSASVYKYDNFSFDDLIKKRLYNDGNGFYTDFGSVTGLTYRLE